MVTFDQIPPALVDATTSVEDKTFWENSGFDPVGFVSAAIDTVNGNDRGGSTITQQLVRARLLPTSAFDGSVYERKAKEIIQSIRLTEAYPGIEGKQQIIEKYLNQNFYGNRSYGVAAAAQSYWKKDLKDLTLAPDGAARGHPPVAHEVRPREERGRGDTSTSTARTQTRLVVPPNSEVIVRRNFILDLMKTRSVLTVGQYTDAEFEAAKAEPVVLASQEPDKWRAPHFVWKVREELGQILCGTSADECEKINTGGYTGHHDAQLQDAADRREVGLRRGDHPQPQEPGQGRSRTAASPAASGAGSRASAGTTSTTRRAASWTTARARCSPMPAPRRTRRRARTSSSRSSTSWATAGASPGRRSSRSCTSSASRTAR